MKLLRLDLIAWGPFSDRRLDFSAAPSALHVIYGANEAGKSTTMRGLKALLYGVDHVTADAWQHAPNKLRVGALLAGDDGTTLEVVRRKGKKDTLLDAQGAPVDETRLSAWLHGVGADQFGSMFGLDHESLRQGGQALLDGGGELGESLFGAALGGVGLHQLQKRLQEEADGLFVPRGRERPLNRALDGYHEARKLSTQSAAGVNAWREGETRISDEHARQAELRRRLDELRPQRNKTERLRAAVPLMAQRARVAEARAKLGPVAALPEDAGALRTDAARVLTEAANRAAERRQKETARAALPTNGTALGEAAATALRDGLVRYRKCVEDLPELVAERATVERELARLRAELAGRVPAQRLDVTSSERLRKLATRQEELRRAVEAAATAERETAALLASRTQALRAVDAPSEAALRAAVSGAERLGDVDARLLQLTTELDELTATTRARLAALGVSEPPEDRTPPTVAAVEAALEAVASSSRAAAALRDRRAETTARAAALQAEVTALTAGRPLPSEADLAAARRTRDALIGADPAALRLAIAAADEVVDRLRHDAALVAERHRLEAARAAAEAELAQLDARLVAADVALGEASALLQSLFAPVEIPVAGRAAGDVRGLAGALAELPAQRARRRTLTREAERLRAARRVAITALGDAGAEELAPRLAVAAAELAELADQRRRHELHARAVAEANDAAVTATARITELRGQAARVAAEWTSEVAAIGLPDARSDEIAALLDHWQRLWDRSDRSDGLARPIELRENDLAAFTAAVDRLAPPDGSSIEARAGALLVSADAARRLDAELAALTAEQQRRAPDVADAERKLAGLLDAAGVSDAALLPALEARADQARKLDSQIDELDGKIAAMTVGLTADPTVDIDRLQAQEEELDAQIKAASDDLEDSLRIVGATEAGLRSLEESSNSAHAAEDAQLHLARSRDLAARFIRLRLARAVLARQLDAYRHDHQGPVLARAGALFARLTRGAYTGLAPGFDDHERPVLRARQQTAAEVDVRALSDGTRDQLYLALRLATLEHHATLAPPMPLILDDILIHFDDERAAAALEALAELTPRLQVLFFTHHARLVDLAGKLPAVVLHRL